MITGELRAKVDRIWDAFWSGGIANPLEVMEQITYLLFIRRLDELQTAKENKANRLGGDIEAPIFPRGEDEQGRPYDELRWSRFRDREPGEMFAVVGERVFPFLRGLGGGQSTYSHHMRDARFTIPTSALLAKVVDMIDELPMEGRDTKGDLYEYMLGKIATAGQNGQFRTPRHIIALMVAMTSPTPTDEICDPACGTAGFLIAASEHVRRAYPTVELEAQSRKHFHHSMFHGFDFDSTMLRIGSMNMLLHGSESPDIRYRDSLSEGAGDEEGIYSLILANPPFAGSLDYETTAQNLLRVVKTKKTELLFLVLFLRLLRPGGRAAVIVPDGALFGSSKAHRELRRVLVEDQKLDAIVKLPSGVFRPYAGVSTAIVFFTKTDSGGTDHVWFYDVRADGFSLDDKRTPLLDESKFGCGPAELLTPEDLEKNNLPDVLARWAQHDGSERGRARTVAKLLRAEGRNRRRGLRPVDQPLQRAGIRGGRTPPAARDHRRAGADRGRDPNGVGGAKGNGWMRASGTAELGDHTIFQSGYAFDSQRFNTEGRGLPLVRIRDVACGRTSTFYDGPFDERFVINSSDWLIAMDGEFNVGQWRGGRALLNQRVAKIVSTTRDLDIAYLVRFLAVKLKIETNRSNDAFGHG